mmetsp:Transcript_5510/g.16638  ORF Transcript_5510/g.16638 Transcript_5510/m.16638 type:complete len:447 (-) Transcript_5510:954-2294(-)
MSALNPEAAVFVFQPQQAPMMPVMPQLDAAHGAAKPAARHPVGVSPRISPRGGRKGHRSKGGHPKHANANRNQQQAPAAPAPAKKVYKVDAVNVSGLNYSVTGALYSPAARATLAHNNYSPTGKLYSPWARHIGRLATELTPAKREAIIKQVDFYFGDSNFPKDKFLQKEVKKRADAFVPLKIIASFTKIKKLTGSWRVVAKAIECSAIVELNVARNSVRRRHKLPDPKMNPTWNRTVVVENLPRNLSIDKTRSMFAAAGVVEHVRQWNDKKVADDIKAYLAAVKNPHAVLRRGKPCTLIEYSSVAEAQSGCAMLTDETNWRSGLRVTMLLPQNMQFMKPSKEGGGDDVGKLGGNHDAVGDGEQVPGEDDGGAAAATAAADRKARRLEKLYAEHPELASVGSGRGRRPKPRAIAGAVMPPGVIRMPTRPDGTRGFTGAGRGRKIAL